MRFIAMLLTVHLAIVLGFCTSPAEASRRAVRQKHCVHVAVTATPQQDGDAQLDVRVYRLQYVSSADARSIIVPLLSQSGSVQVSSASEAAVDSSRRVCTSNGAAAIAITDANSTDRGKILIVQDREYVLKAIDRVIAKFDVQPAQVLVETMIVQVTLKKDVQDTGVKLAALDEAKRPSNAVGNNAAIDAAGGVELRRVSGSTTGFIRALQEFGDLKVLAAPRLLVLNKQRAEIRLGGRFAYKTPIAEQNGAVQKVNYVELGTRLRVRPFVASDGMVRLEVHAEHSSTTGWDDRGVPEVTTRQITANVMMRDGTTVAMGGLTYSETIRGQKILSLLRWTPYIGCLLPSGEDDAAKKQLVVFLTPHLWKR
jgi:type II secretory pathway component GspD/PulD (secretin)